MKMFSVRAALAAFRQFMSTAAAGDKTITINSGPISFTISTRPAAPSDTPKGRLRQAVERPRT